MKEITKVNLLTSKYSYIPDGLYYDLISACISGKNPSPIKETNRYKAAKIVIGLLTLSLEEFWK